MTSDSIYSGIACSSSSHLNFDHGLLHKVNQDGESNRNLKNRYSVFGHYSTSNGPILDCNDYKSTSMMVSSNFLQVQKSSFYGFLITFFCQCHTVRATIPLGSRRSRSLPSCKFSSVPIPKVGSLNMTVYDIVQCLDGLRTKKIHRPYRIHGSVKAF